MTTETSKIAIVGGGPAGLVMAIALARKGIKTAVLERDQHPAIASRFNPDRSYAIDITGHGLKALRYIDACDVFDNHMLPFKGIKMQVGRHTKIEPWNDQGWTGSRGDILLALLDKIEGQYANHISLRYETAVTDLNVYTGDLTTRTPNGTQTDTFDFIIGADGGGSAVRQAMEKQLPAFTTHYEEIPNYATMLELDRNIDTLDPTYLHILNRNPFCVAGAINGATGKESVRWFCAVGTNHQLQLDSTQAAQQFFAQKAPSLLDLISPQSLTAFAQRQCFHIGKMLSCSQLYGGKAVLLGDAGAPFSPIGQGINAAMESAIWLDQEILSANPIHLYQAAQRYSLAWKPEADAVTWICKKLVYGRPSHILRMALTTPLGLNVLSNAKQTHLSYAQVKRQARALRPLWVS
ncbi:MAG: FAD-dependent monooxygenase [Anaerolineales bacterium]|nr:FAD-dependent monooxygenase [Anaerolineales bacterium]